MRTTDTHFKLLRQIPMFSPYEIRIRLGPTTTKGGIIHIPRCTHTQIDTHRYRSITEILSPLSSTDSGFATVVPLRVWASDYLRTNVVTIPSFCVPAINTVRPFHSLMLRMVHSDFLFGSNQERFTCKLMIPILEFLRLAVLKLLLASDINI